MNNDQIIIRQLDFSASYPFSYGTWDVAFLRIVPGVYISIAWKEVTSP